MSSKKILHLVTGLNPKCPKKTAPYFEKSIRELYLKTAKDLCINFSHDGVSPFETADVIKKKKVSVVIFDGSVSIGRMLTVINAIKKRTLEGAPPRIIHISAKQIVDGTELAIDHATAKKILAN